MKAYGCDENKVRGFNLWDGGRTEKLMEERTVAGMC